jgi:polyisoprenoid-binding protein YceI
MELSVQRRLLFLVAGTLLFPPIAKAQAPARGAAPAPMGYVLAPDGNEVRFIVREQLAGATLPNDAIGSTRAVTGTIVLDRSGKVDPSASRIVVFLDSLKSDQERRDRFIKRRTLVTDSFPTATFVPTELQGFPSKLPQSGALTFSILGDFTVHGVTKAVSWDVTANVAGGAIAGKATTHVQFGDFGMERPRVAIVLSVVDDIKLEFDFKFVPAPAGP